MAWPQLPRCPVCQDPIDSIETDRMEATFMGDVYRRYVPGPTTYHPCGCVVWPEGGTKRRDGWEELRDLVKEALDG